MARWLLSIAVFFVVFSGCGDKQEAAMEIPKPRPEIFSLVSFFNFSTSDQEYFEAGVEEMRPYVSRADVGLLSKVVDEYMDIVRSSAQKYEVPVPVARGILLLENSGGIDKISSAGAAGIAQLMPDVARHLGLSVEYKLQSKGFFVKRIRGGKTSHHSLDKESRAVRDSVLRGRRRIYVQAKYGYRRTPASRAMVLVRDDRLDPSLAIPAAVRFMRMLYDKYGRWDLVLLAYQQGETRTNRIIRFYLGLESRSRVTPQLIAKNNLNFPALHRHSGVAGKFWRDKRNGGRNYPFKVAALLSLSQG